MLDIDKILVIGVIAVLLLGPTRLPQYAARLAQFVKTLRSFADTAKERMREEMGPEFDDIEWQKLDPRQYDPRRIIRDALLDSTIGAGAATATQATVTAPSVSARPAIVPLEAGESAPFDVEST